MSKLGHKFRDVFKVNHLDLVAWYPGHMQKGMIVMQRKLKNIDCIIEVHDARLPFSGRNRDFSRLLTKARPHILLLNKMDLADVSNMDHVVHQLRREGLEEVIFTNFTRSSNKGLQTVIPAVTNVLNRRDRFNRTMEEDFHLLVIGVPNVGKSTLVNVLRNMYLHKKGNATASGKSPGVTRAVLEKIRVCEEPRIYIRDSPGVLSPDIKSKETALKLALCATVKDDIVGADLVADYMLYWLNKNRKFMYVDVLNLQEPSDDIYYVLAHTAARYGKTRLFNPLSGPLERRLDLYAAAMILLRNFREGRFGKVCLDSDMFPDDTRLELQSR